MKVFVKGYDEEQHETRCIVVDSGAEIRVDPFAGCAIACDEHNYKDVGRSLVGKTYEMSDYFILSDGCYAMNEGGFTEAK